MPVVYFHFNFGRHEQVGTAWCWGWWASLRGGDILVVTAAVVLGAIATKTVTVRYLRS